MYLYNGSFNAVAPALAHAKETPNIALAPSLDLFFAPSNLINVLSISF